MYRITNKNLIKLFIVVFTIFLLNVFFSLRFPRDVYATNVTSDITASSSNATEKEITLTMLGDNILHETTINTGKIGNNMYNYDFFYRNIKDIVSNASIAIINQESVCGGKEFGLYGYPAFNSAFEVVDAEAKAGFDVLLHATNHCVDRGFEQTKLALSYIRNNYPNIKTTGLYDTEEASRQLCIIEKNGIKVGIINYTYGLNGSPLPYPPKKFAVDYWNDTLIAIKVQNAKKLCDFVVVCPHWGKEYSFEPIERQKYEAKFLSSLGVDLIIGTHPHVIEKVEWVGNTLCYYSIGNGINYAGNYTRFLGLMPYITIAKNKNKCYIKKIKTIPVVMHLGQNNDFTLYKLQDYTQELRNQNTFIHRDSNFTLQNLYALFFNTVDKQFIGN